MDPLLDTAPCGFLVVGDDGHVELANATIAEMLGARPGDLAGRHVDVVLTTPSRIFYQTHVFPTLRLQGRVHEVYVSLIGAGGEEVPVMLNLRRRTHAGRTVSDWAVIPMRQRNEYENEILAARREAQAATRARDQFLALVSHELRSPLSAIRNWAAILARGESDPATLKRGLEAIERNAVLQARLVDDILDEVRVTTGKLRVELAELDARAILESVLESATPMAAAKSVALEREIPARPMRVHADRDRLQQILWNVASNAVKFTPAGGRVLAAMRSDSGWVEVAVTDTGKGISAEFLPHLFESFRQEEGPAMRSEGGLGLGMAITCALVELHGGSIFATSPGPGRGSTFTVRLPEINAL